jgi:hypothetical protein
MSSKAKKYTPVTVTRPLLVIIPVTQFLSASKSLTGKDNDSAYAFLGIP